MKNVLKCSSVQVLKWGFGLAPLVLAIILAGCSEKSAEPDRKAHPTGWSDPASANFHGQFLTQRGTPDGLQACRECHGEDNSTTATGVSCFGCHNQFPHPAGWSGTGTPNLHQTFIQQQGWKIESCKACHGADFHIEKEVGGQLVSCYTCHTGSSGPQGCRVCHGGANSSAPPADLLGGTSTDLVTVGAHQAHLEGSTLSAGISCSDCHLRPSGFDDPAHIDTLTPGRAEVTFGALSTDSGRVTPVWNRDAGTCSSVYCHGNFSGGDTSLAVRWTGGPAEAECGSCHGMPPANPPHPVTSQGCWACHTYNAANHVNGVVDFR
jgi:predicted CxxxxCH...CXXCH cytochrome family protein